jgi:heat-inducible transcriptional repressor
MAVLSPRQELLLRKVVEAYTATGIPVGSKALAADPEIQAGPSTVRNELATLEEQGLLAHPHTSAGRVPTDKGYRYFVDNYAQPTPLAAAQAHEVRAFFDRTHGELEQMLARTSNLLSDLTRYAAVVVGPQHEASTIRAAQLVSLGPRVALVVLVLSNGAVERQTIEVDEEIGEERIAAATAHLTAHLVGKSLAGVPPIPRTGDQGTDRLVAEALKSLTDPEIDHDVDHVFVGGASRMADAFDAVDTVREVLRILEQQLVVVSLLRDVLDSGLNVAIGTELGVQPLAECSIVVAPYEIEGERAGTVGVLGPTRMDYPHALAAVALVSKRLSQRLTEG